MQDIIDLQNVEGFWVYDENLLKLSKLSCKDVSLAPPSAFAPDLKDD